MSATLSSATKSTVSAGVIACLRAQCTRTRAHTPRAAEPAPESTAPRCWQPCITIGTAVHTGSCALATPNICLKCTPCLCSLLLRRPAVGHAYWQGALEGVVGRGAGATGLWAPAASARAFSSVPSEAQIERASGGRPGQACRRCGTDRSKRSQTIPDGLCCAQLLPRVRYTPLLSQQLVCRPHIARLASRLCPVLYGARAL